MTRLSAALLALVLVLTGCSLLPFKSDALIVSGETLVAADKQFRVVAEAYVDDCGSGRLAREECLAFRRFAERWIHDFPLAVDLWVSAKETGDVATTKGAAATVTKLVSELSVWALKLAGGAK